MGRSNAALPLLVATTLVGCSGSEPVYSPTAPSATASITQVETPQDFPLQLRGFVTDTAYRPLAGALVEVLDGASAGVTTIAGADGQFVLSGRFNATTQFRASKDGHETRTQPWNCSVAVCLVTNDAQPWLGFYLTVLEPTVNLAGDYILTFVADGACTDLPEIARGRSYRVAVTPQPLAGRSAIPGFDLKVIGSPVVGNMTGFPIGVAGSRLSFWLHGGHDPAIVEYLGANSYLAFSGNATVAVGPTGLSSITATFDGWIEHVVLMAPMGGPWYYPQGAISKSTCESRTHRLTLTRES